MAPNLEKAQIMFKLTKNTILMIIAVLAIIITAVIVFAKINSVDIASYLKFDKKMSNEAIVEKAMNYLNNSNKCAKTMLYFTNCNFIIKICWKHPMKYTKKSKIRLKWLLFF